MADKYCIASGSWPDTAIWSNTNGGNGGASVPAENDNIIFAAAVTITNLPELTASGKFIVQNGITAEIQQIPDSTLTFNADGGFEIDGTLIIISGLVYFTSSAQCRITAGAVLDISNNTAIYLQGSSQLINEGTILCTTEYFPHFKTVTLYPNTGSPKHQLGRCSNAILRDANGTVCGISHAPTILDQFCPYHIVLSQKNKCLFETEATILKELSFYNTKSTALTLEHSAAFNVCGDIRISPGTVGQIIWNSIDDAPLVFTGTNDQTISMPDNITGQNWTVDKTAGLLDLVQFNGFLQGRASQLIVRTGSHITLSGTAPLLSTSHSDPALYQGLKADASSAGQLLDRDSLLRESLDYCYNFGIITIPEGKVLCAKIFRSEPYSDIQGSGTIYVRDGEFKHLGSIDESITIQYFDFPICASLSAPSDVTANVEFSVDLSGSIGDMFRVDWADGTFSETTASNQLFHAYTDPGINISRMVVLTVTNSEGTQETASQTILLHSEYVQPPEPPAPDPPITEIQVRTVDMVERQKYFGVPRGNMPFPYRYTLAQGKSFMYDTLQLFCPMNESGRALENGSGLYLGRIAYADGQTVMPEDVASVSYTIYRLDDSNASVRTAVEGHEDVPLEIEDVLLSETITDENWKFDEAGYNFRHTPDDTMYPPFPKAGRNYLVAYTLQRLEGKPKIQLQYRVRVV